MSATVLERALLAHPWIGAARMSGDGTIGVRPDPAALAVSPTPGALIVEFLDHWGEVYDFTYQSAHGRHAADLDLSGWRATDTGQPLPTAHMIEWLQRTVALTLRTRPDWIVEVGCGTGMLMHRLHPHVRGYVGTDLVDATVRTVSAGAPSHTRLVAAAAHEVAAPIVREALADLGGPDAGPDCVLINSVTQCFPNVDYLAAVIHGAVGLVAAGGTVVVGDVRHSGLLDHYSRWAERAADPNAAGSEVERRAAARAARDEELLFDPAVLATVAAGTGREVRMTTYAKTMRADTELTRYRFDAVLHVDAPPVAATPTRQVVWHALPADDRLAALRAELTAGPIQVSGIPHRLLRGDTGGPPGDTGDGVDAFQLWEAAGEGAAVSVDLTDPTLLAVTTPADRAAVPVEAVAGTGVAHEPLPRFLRRRLAEEARRHLRRVLPDQAGVTITVDFAEVTR
jgi:hypothetical protein